MKRQIGWLVGMLLLGTLGSGIAAPGTETWLDPETGMPFVAVAKGCFSMGSEQPKVPPADTMWQEVGYDGSLAENEKPRHEVCVDGFWLGKYEVRVKEWRTVMGSDGLTGPGGVDDDFPMTRVTWEQARLFAQRLTEKSGGKQRYRLPTEAEWEYACRAGSTQDAFANQELLEKEARYGLGSQEMNIAGARLGATGQRSVNAFGLHDMLGNAWEWVQDSYLPAAYATHSLYNPRVEAKAGQRVIRGGSFRTEFSQVRCGKRGHFPATEVLDSIGFRLVRER